MWVDPPSPATARTGPSVETTRAATPKARDVWLSQAEHADAAGAEDLGVEQATGAYCGHPAAGGGDLIAQPRLERQQVAPVDGEPVAVEVEHRDVAARLGEPDDTPAAHPHQVLALTADRPPDEPAHTLALVGEVHLPAVGDHRPLLGVHLAAVEADPQHAVTLLQGERRPTGGAGSKLSQSLRHDRSTSGVGPRCRARWCAAAGRSAQTA